MKHSAERILTTHVGSLPRPEDLVALVRSRESAEPGDPAVLTGHIRSAVFEVVRQQASLGLDIIDDGEFGKPSFIHYVNERLGGFEPSVAKPAGSPFAGSREFRSFPQFYQLLGRGTPGPAAKARRMDCVGPVTYIGQAQLQADLDNLKSALAAVRVEEAFVPAIAPSNVTGWQNNRYYRTEEEFVFAVADAMREEYSAIIDAGLLLQIDDPRLVTQYNKQPDMSLEEVRKWAWVQVEALNHALRGLPRDRIRFHTCYSINMGPRVHDMELKDVIDIVLSVRAGAYSFEAANPRHEHEWRVWRDVKLPDDALLIPGVITQSSVLVEHPDLVAERIVRFAGVVGRERVIAGADCGFGSFAGSDEIHASIVWAKLGSLVEGARRASRQLWG